QKFEELIKELFSTGFLAKETIKPKSFYKELELGGIFEKTSNGKLHLTVPVDMLTSKEALALMLYAHYPNSLTDNELSDLLSSCWKPTSPEAVRARASELRREGKLISENGKYKLSGAGIQWLKLEVIRRLNNK
ncbi:MAG: hypothetical protein QXE19_03730, partial [Candidatus Bathyarchaeia archaeon]